MQGKQTETTENMACKMVTGEKETVEEGGGVMGQERREVHVTGGKMKGRKEVRVDISKGILNIMVEFFLLWTKYAWYREMTRVSAKHTKTQLDMIFF